MSKRPLQGIIPYLPVMESEILSFEIQCSVKTWSPDKMKCAWRGSQSVTPYGDVLSPSFRSAVGPLLLALASISIKWVCGSPEGPKLGLKGGQEADFPEAESGCDQAGGR